MGFFKNKLAHSKKKNKALKKQQKFRKQMNIGQHDLCLLLQVIWESTLPDIYF